ncbi:hypothetical protein T265_11652 [Opisthorchis viverrini]|uniref:Deoxyuridine 5'-triphosphate nucleotidohydrolase n=1 Tax=Opisthorchis viverrini TaxID=6198 RepID=A0A074Z8T0_OPIVI|nr:hypothetical protein T265_11652 [Opisthorchis viverrini]KER19625.1 hypothetical protein T265_11652 [Opisthorchis viverrini]
MVIVNTLLETLILISFLAMADVMLAEKRPKITNGLTHPHAVLKFVKLSEHATTPTRGSPLAAGYDLYAAHDTVLPAKDRGLVKTDIQIALPDGCYGRVAPRSGLALKHGIDVGAGVVDQDYRGNVGVVLFNFGNEDFQETVFVGPLPMDQPGEHRADTPQYSSMGRRGTQTAAPRCHGAPPSDGPPSALFEDWEEVLSRTMSDLFVCIWKKTVPNAVESSR